MTSLPPYFVTLSHATWEDAAACARRLPPEALPELRLDLLPGTDPEEMIRALGRKCLVTCRRRRDGGAWEGEESARIALLVRAAQARPAWMDLEWELPVPADLAPFRSHMRLLRSVHADAEVFDLEALLERLPEGEAFKWVGRAGRLGDNARVRSSLAWARDREVPLSAFLMGPKGLASRCMQFAWGGAFTYAAPDDALTAVPGQIPLGRMMDWRCHKLHAGHKLCGVLGSPVLHSRGPAFHNARFKAAFKDLLYLPLECGDAAEALEALEALDILGASLTAPLKETLPPLLGLPAPLNTLYRRSPGDPWQGANTDAVALDAALAPLAPGPVLVLGDGGVAATSRAVVEGRGGTCLQVSRKRPPREAIDPVGIIQATSLGMEPGDPLPFPELLEGTRAAWAVEWVYKEETAFAAWARERGLQLVSGETLFEAQARAQSELFVRHCGGA